MEFRETKVGEENKGARGKENSNRSEKRGKRKTKQ